MKAKSNVYVAAVRVLAAITPGGVNSSCYVNILGGLLLGCCTMRYATFDVNVFEVGLLEAIRSPKYIAAKECLMTVQPEKERYSACVCYNCEKRLLRERAGLAFELKV